MANLRQRAEQPDLDGNGIFGGDDQGEGGVGRPKVMPTPAYEQTLDGGEEDPSGGVGRQKSDKGQGGESPREREQAQQTGNGGNDAGAQFQSAPRQPSVPSPMAGTESMAGPQGIIPFSPMGGPDAASQASPRLRSLYGGGNGLTGGGLGVPLDPISNQQSDPISMLMQLLQGR